MELLPGLAGGQRQATGKLLLPTEKCHSDTSKAALQPWLQAGVQHCNENLVYKLTKYREKREGCDEMAEECRRGKARSLFRGVQSWLTNPKPLSQEVLSQQGKSNLAPVPQFRKQRWKRTPWYRWGGSKRTVLLHRRKTTDNSEPETAHGRKEMLSMAQRFSAKGGILTPCQGNNQRLQTS